jgi:hypothetical protein
MEYLTAREICGKREVSGFSINCGQPHFEIHVIDIRYSIFKPPSRGRLEPTRSAGGGSVCNIMTIDDILR